MAIITVPSATQGRSYNVKISGDVPTPTEQARIAQYVAEQDAASQARVEKYFGAQQQQAPAAPEKGGIAGITNALGRSVDVTQQGAYSALEGLGSSTGIDWLREFGRAGAEANTKQLEESQAARTQYEDIKGVGSAASFVGETVAESAVPMGISIAGAAGTGAAVGAAVTAWAGPGAALGAGAGAIIGAAGAALSQLPLFYGWNRERQKQEDVTAGRPVEVDEGTAALAAIPQASVEAFQDLFIVGKLAKLFPKAVVNKGGVLTRLVKGSVAGSVSEVPTEVGQQFLERYQAGLPLFDDEAVSEYEQAAIAAGLAGGTIGGGVAVVQGDAAAKEKAKEDELKKKQLLEDDASMQKDYEATQIFAAQNTAELAKANALEPQAPEAPQEAPRMLPPPKAGEEPKLKVAPVVNPAAYTPEMRSRAVAFATSGKNFTLGEFHQHMNEVTKTNIPKQSIADLMADLKSERVIRTDYRTGSTSASRKFAPTKYAAQARERLDSFINESATLEAEAKSLSDVNDKLSADLRAAEQTGSDLSGKKANTSAIGRQIDENTASIAEKLKRAADARAEAAKMPESLAPSPVERKGLPPGIKAAPLSQATPKAAAPRQEAIQQSLADNINAVKALASKKKSLSGRQLSSIEQVALDDTERKIAALKLRRVELVSQAKSPEAAIQDAQNQEAADNAKALAAQVRADAASRANEQAQLQTMGVAQPSSGPATAPVFDTKAQNVFGTLRGRLNKLGLGNVRLAAESTLGARGEASGTYNPKQRLISLAMGIYDPKLSEQELFDRVARVMDHEAIHALKSVGVFNDAEWATLTRAAKEMKYKAMKNGKLEERSYSYLDRAENMYDGTIPRADWGSTTIATDLISPQVLKALRKAAGKSKVKLGETVSLETIDKLVGEQTATEVAKIEFAAEEAVAEMFGDYVQGRIKFVGKPKTLFERIKTFFRGLIGASVDNGITDAQSILDDIQSGAVGARPQTAMSQAAQPVARPQSIEPNLLASAVAQQEAAKPKPTSGVRQSKISKEDWPSNNWVERMYAENMEFPYSRSRQFAIGFDPNEKGEVQSFAAVAMVPETKTTAYIDWFQAYPGRVGVGSRAMQVLINSARENNIKLRLSPWSDGKISKAQLIKFYKRNGFTLEKDGSMIFDPAISTSGVRQSKMTADEVYKARNDAYEERASLMGNISNYLKGGVETPTVDEIAAWINQSDTRYQDLPRVTPKSINSPEFKMFFGKSQLTVSDQNGREYPRRVFHGGLSGDIYEFDFSKIGPDELGFHVGTAEQANEFAFGLAKDKPSGEGVMYPLYARLENPVRLTDLGGWSEKTVIKQMHDRGMISDQQYKMYSAMIKQSKDPQAKIRSILQDNLGYDGIVYVNRYEGWSDEDMRKAKKIADQARKSVGMLVRIMTDEQINKIFPSAQDSYILLKPTQLKSAVGNNGEYSNLNKDIRYSSLVPRKGIEDGSQNAPAQGEGVAGGSEQVRGEVRPTAETGIDAAGIGASQHPVTVEDLLNPDTDFEEFVKRPGWAAFSATNNKIEPKWRKVEQRAQSMRDHLNHLKVPFKEVYGYYHGETDGPSFLVIMEPEAARRFAAQYQQDSILTSAGLIYIRDVPPTLSTGEVMFGDEAKIQEGYTYIPDKNLTFSLGLDDSTWPGTPVIPDGYELVEKRPQLPVKDGKVRLLHWSPKVLTKLDPAYAGKREGPTANIIGAERNDRHKKVFFGINPRESGRQRGTGYIKENLGENMHEVFVDPKSLYPWFQDPDGLWSGPTRIKELNQQERNEYEGLIIKAGYLGSYVTEDGDTNLDVQSYAPLGNVASIYYPIKVNHVTPERQSRMVAKVQPVRNIPEDKKRLTVLDMMDPETGSYIQRQGKKITVMDALRELFNRRSDVVINSDDPDAVDRMADLIALEAQMAILRNPGAIGWYGETLTMAKRVAAIMYPEISKVNPYTGEPSNSYVAMNEHIWDLATAITSNGQAVLDNFTHAAEQYEYWKIHGRFKPVGYGKQSTGIVSGLKFYNSMRDVGYSDEQVQEFLNLKMPVSELKKHPVVKRLGIKIGSSEKASTEVYGSYVLGPKIGQGFYQNLRGNFTPLTMDIWFNRLFNRISGKPFAVVTDKTRLANYERISALIDNPMLTEYERGLLDAAKAVTSIDIVTPENVGDLAIAYDKLFQRDYTNTKTREIKRLVALGYDPKADETKALGNAARPVKTELIQAMGTASQNFKQTEQAAPRGGGERAFMRQVIDRAQTNVLKATGLDVNTADFQALLWYAEKQLFKAMNIREGRGGDNDYVDGVIHFLRSRDISDEEIKRVLPADQRDRLVSGTDSGRANAGVLSGAEALDSGQEDGGNQLLSAKPNGQRETAVARNGGVGRGAKPKRGVEAVAAAKVEDVERFSRMVAHAPQGKATPFTGQSDLMKHTDSLRYAAVQGAVSRLIQRTAGKYFKIDPKIIDDKTAGFFKKMQDDMIYVGKMYDSLRAKGINIPQEYDSYFQDQLMRDTAGAKKQDFQEGFLRKIIETAVNAKFNSTNVDALDKAVRAATGAGSYISEIVKKVGNESHAIANAYLYALHAKERNKRIKEMSKGKDTQGSGMSDAEADAILNWAKTLPQIQQTALDNVDKLAQDIVWMTNDEYIQGGLIPVYNDDKATLDDGTEVDFPQYDNYVPLRGFTDLDSTEDKSEGGNGFGKFSGSKPNKAAVGRASYAGDILVNIGTQYEAAVDKAARNKVGQSMLDLIENNASEMSAIAVVLNSNPLKKVVVNGTIRSVPDRDFTGDITDFPILPVRRNGKEILIGFHDKNIADAMKGSVSASTPGAVMSAVHNITRVYANLLTSWNPAFVLSNLPRDIETAIFNSQQYEMKGSAGSIIKKVGPSIKAIWGVINDTGAGDPHLRMRYKQFYENGGQSVFNGMVNLSNSTASVQEIIKEVEGLESGNALFKSKHFFTKTLLGKVEAANTAVENGTRLAFFDAMMNQLEKDGVPTKIAAKRAAYAAKNLTTNFTKGGEYRNFFNTFYLFYNASLQGSMAMMNSLVRSKKARKMAASIVVMGFVMDMLNAAASDDEDKDGILDYDNFNENRLTRYILIPDFTGSGTHISIPMAYGLNIFYNAGRTLSNYVRGVAGAKGTYTASEAAASTVGQVVATINPFGGNNMLSFIVPTQGDLVVELMSNKDFKDQPIYKELSPFDQSKSRSNLYWSTTSPSAVFVSKFLNDTLGGGTDVIPGEILGQRMDIQPDVIEHVLGFLTGGLGSFLGASLDTATSTLPDAMSGKWSADMVGKTPILNKFLTQVSEKDKAGDYYTNRDKVMVVQAEIRDAIASGDGERIAAAKATYPERIKVMGRIGEIEKRLAKLRKTKKLVTESTRMPEDKKQKSIDNINQAINKLMALGNQIMGDAGV